MAQLTTLIPQIWISRLKGLRHHKASLRTAQVLRRHLVRPLQRHQFLLFSVCFGWPTTDHSVIRYWATQPRYHCPTGVIQSRKADTASWKWKSAPKANQTKEIFKFPATATTSSWLRCRSRTQRGSKQHLISSLRLVHICSQRWNDEQSMGVMQL